MVFEDWILVKKNKSVEVFKMLCISINPKMKNEKWLYIAISKINIVNDQDK